MAVCPRCSIENVTGEEFCKKCGSFLLTEMEPLVREEKARGIRICPKCQSLCKKGNYCKKCGSLLIQAVPINETTFHLLRRKLFKKWSKECMRILREKKELERCLIKLETQRDQIPADFFNPIFSRYQDQWKELSSLHQEMEGEIESIRKKTSEQIDILKKELDPIQERFGQIQSLYNRGAITKVDLLREKKKMREEIESRERSLKGNRQILSLLSNERRGGSILSQLRGNLLRPLTLLAMSVIIILISAGGYFLWGWHPQSNRAISEESLTSPSTPFLPDRAGMVVEIQESENIRSLFENIKQANLRKDIELFMACYTKDFKGRERKRIDTLETWKHFNYLALSYDLKKQTISGDTADVKLEWLIRIVPKAGRQQQESRIILESTLKREDGCWKIKEIKIGS